MLSGKQYYVYIMTNKDNKVLYTGVTNNLERRTYEHKNHTVKGFTSRYNVEKLVYFYAFSNIDDAIVMEKKIKGWKRDKKNALINEFNPYWEDLALLF